MAIAQNFPNIAPSLDLSFALTKKLDPRITFARASTATYYGTETAKAEENLVLQSQTLDSASWVKNEATVTANTIAAPDGTTTADTITESTANTAHRIQSNSISWISGQTYVISFFAKNGDADYVQLSGGGALGAGIFANFDIATGVTGSSNGVTSSIVDVGGGWYRCIMVVTAVTTTAQDFSIGLANSASLARLAAYTGTSRFAYIWGAQAEARSSLTAYTPTTTQPITNYIPVLETASANVARFDHNPLTFESLGLLVEEQRTNLLTYSEDFSDSDWTKTNATITADTIVAPDGTLTGDKFVINSGQANTSALAVQDITKSATATTYTYTVYGKIGEFNQLQIPVRETANSANFATVRFSLIDGTIVSAASAVGTFTNASASVGVSVGNGWYRFALTFTSSTETSIRPQIIVRDSVATTGDGYSGIYIWGAQLE